MKKILVVFAHPAAHKSKVHKELSEAARTVEGLTISDLYGKYPDFFINVREEQRLLLENDIIVLDAEFSGLLAAALLSPTLSPKKHDVNVNNTDDIITKLMNLLIMTTSIFTTLRS